MPIVVKTTPEAVHDRAGIVRWLRWISRNQFIPRAFVVQPGEQTGVRILRVVADMLEAGVDVEHLAKVSEGAVASTGNLVVPSES